MAIGTLSRNGVAAALVAALGAIAAPRGGCATGKEAQVRKIQARNAYDQAGGNIREGRVSLGLAALQDGGGARPREPPLPERAGRRPAPAPPLARGAGAIREGHRARPAYAEAYHNLGLVLAAQDRLDQAVASYRKALTFPTYPSPELAYHNLGRGLPPPGQAPGGGGGPPPGHPARDEEPIFPLFAGSCPRRVGPEGKRPGASSSSPGTSTPTPPSGSSRWRR